jgi:hypothetical protein
VVVNVKEFVLVDVDDQLQEVTLANTADQL